MQILLLGVSSTITDTLHSMLQSVNHWIVKTEAELNSLSNPESPQNSDYDLLIVNLEDFDTSSIPLINQINSQFPKTPLLVVHSYSEDNYIQPMLNAGATGYARVGISEHELLEIIKKVADGQQLIITDSTY